MALLLRIAGSYVFRAPLYATRVQVAWTPSFAYRNLLLSTLKPQPVGKIVTALPPIPVDYPASLRTWTRITPLRAVLVGKIVTALPSVASEYPTQLRSWVGAPSPALGALPVGEIVTALPLTVDYPTSLRSWVGTPPPTPAVVINYVFRAPLYTNPRGPEYPVQLRTWTTVPSLALLAGGVVALPAGKIVTELPPRAHEYHVQLRSWIWTFNRNLIAQDQLPAGKIGFDLPIPPVYPVQLRTWINAITAGGLLAPFKQLDWAVPRGYEYPVQLRTWQWSYNLNLVGQDFVPGKISSELSPRLTPALFQTWVTSLNLNLLTTPQTPFEPSDTRLPATTPPPSVSFATSFNLNLIGQDALPVGKQVTDLPPQPSAFAIQLRTWISTTSLALAAGAAGAPFRQLDWPNPTAPTPLLPTTSSAYNPNLVGQDQLPFRQLSWPLPTQPFRQPQLASWIDRTKLLLAVPFRQLDWPVPVGPQQPNRSFVTVFPRTLVGADALPFRQLDWPLPIRAVPPASPSWFTQTVLPIPGGTPFRPSDTRLAIGTDYPVDLRSTFTNRALYGGGTPPQTPITQTFPFIANIGSMMNRS